MCMRPSSLEPNARRLGLRCLLDVPPSFCLVTRSLGLRTRFCELHLLLTSLTETAVHMQKSQIIQAITNHTRQ